MTVAVGKDRSEFERKLTQARGTDAEEMQRPRHSEGLHRDGSTPLLDARRALFDGYSDGCRSEIGGTRT
jgi:hypothetical protein